MALIAPSILSADFANLQRDIELLNDSQADWIHVDVMDGMFVPNISFGIPVCEAVQRHAKKVLDVHLMIEQPDRYLTAFRKAGADRITVHYEACTHLHRSIQAIKETGALAGVAINPHTPVEVLQDILPEVSLVLIMSVNPGFGGQQFIENTYSKVERLYNMREKAGLDFVIEVDGGVTSHNITKLAQTGVDAFVAGSFVFANPNPTSVIAELKALSEVTIQL